MADYHILISKTNPSTFLRFLNIFLVGPKFYRIIAGNYLKIFL